MSIDFELAKELKDAGFPQEKTAFVFYIVKTGNAEPVHLLRVRYGLSGYSDKEVLGCFDAPTLEELIEACGREFYSLVHEISRKGEWRTFSTPDDQNTIAVQYSSTPEEAVARMWLALNKKS